MTGIGLGGNDSSLPAGMQAVAAHIDRVNRTTGEAIRLDYFRFAADAETSAGMAQGGGSGAADPRPIIDGASWFGFSSAVDPFVLETGPEAERGSQELPGRALKTTGGSAPTRARVALRVDVRAPQRVPWGMENRFAPVGAPANERNYPRRA